MFFSQFFHQCFAHCHIVSTTVLGEKIEKVRPNNTGTVETIRPNNAVPVTSVRVQHKYYLCIGTLAEKSHTDWLR